MILFECPHGHVPAAYVVSVGAFFVNGSGNIVCLFCACTRLDGASRAICYLLFFFCFWWFSESIFNPQIKQAPHTFVFWAAL